MQPHRPLTIAILLASSGSALGGMEKHTEDLAGELASRGHKVHVLAHPSYAPHFSQQVTFHSLPFQCGRRNPWLSHRLKQTLRQIGPDITHAQGNKAARLLSRQPPGIAKVRIGTVHGTKTSHRDFERLDHTIAVSQDIYDRLEHPGRVLIHNGISRPAVPSSKTEDTSHCPGLTPGKTNVIAVGRLEPVKNFALLIRAWVGLTQTHSNAHLTIFGEGSERQKLERLINEYNAAGSISLPGYFSPMEAAYRQADLTVISSDREGFPYALIESLLAGCPVISTPVSGARDVLPASALSADHQLDSLTRLLAQSLDDLPKLAAAEQAATAFARDHLTLEAMVTETEKLYQQAMLKATQH